jgi:hypothetical protein|nr:hypothetical protein [uncultured Dongia sp.]
MAAVTRSPGDIAVDLFDRVGGLRQLKWLLPVLISLGIMVALIVYLRPLYESGEDAFITTGFAIFLCAFLSALPPVLCFVQNVSRRRQLSKLESMQDLPLAKTTSYRVAKASMETGRLVVDADYALPIFLYFFITFVGFVAIFLGYSRAQYFTPATVLLGGLQDRTQGASFVLYQLHTFAVVAMAFMGSYVYVLGRILDRINNNDLYPISLYYYTARIIIACAAAAVLRHAFVLFGNAGDAVLPQQVSTNIGAALLILVGFTVGFAPDLFILVMSRKAFQYFKIWGSRSEPDGKNLPRSLPLLMIDDLTREKIDRLNELGIDSAQILARQNPFVLLPRLPYDLGLIVDWIAQAQLYVLVKDKALESLRTVCVRNILDLAIRLGNDDAARKEICGLLVISDSAGIVLLQQLREDPLFLRLHELAAALRPEAS